MNANVWLARRIDSAPEKLTELMYQDGAQELEGDVASILATRAAALYSRAVEGKGTRADAYPLLAADALLTHAFEAKADMDPEGIGEFARSLLGLPEIWRTER